MSLDNVLRQYVSESDSDFIALQQRMDRARARMLIGAWKRRGAVSKQLIRQWLENDLKDMPVTIIGGGIHGTIAALNAQSRVQVVEKVRFGGVFQTQYGASYFLNSRNRPPREVNIPGSDGALNYLPGGKLQPSDLSGVEYQTNDDLATVIRWNLAMSDAHVVQSNIDKVIDIDGKDFRLRDRDGYYADTEKIVLATGLGDHNIIRGTTQSKSFFNLLVSDRFPLKGLKRVAVIGAGDSGNAVVEALMGQGPSQGMSVASLDWVERVDWYGQEARSRDDFESCARSRYVGLARYFPDDGNYYRIEPKPRMVEVTREREVRYLDSVGSPRYGGPYDLIINATGYRDRTDELLKSLGVLEWEEVQGSDGEAIGLKLRGKEIYKVGPAANLPITEEEIERIPVLGDPRTKNAVAIFRYAQRTAELIRRITSPTK